MTRALDLTGQRFGRLVVQRLASAPGQARRWLCACDCGGEKEVARGHLLNGHAKSCGCYRRECLSTRVIPQKPVVPPPVAPGEVWRPIIGASRYSVSSLGRVASPSGKIIGYPDKNGYRMALIAYDDGRRKATFVHQLVAAAFIGPCPAGSEVDHINRQRADNTLSNLRYLTRSENARQIDTVRGERHPQSKLTEELVAEIRAIPAAPRYRKRGQGNHPNSIISIAKRYGLDFSTVHQIRTGRRWKHSHSPTPPPVSAPLDAEVHELSLPRGDTEDLESVTE